MNANLLALNSPKRIFCSSISNNNSLKFTTAHSIPLIKLGTLVSSSIVISLSLTKYHLSRSCYFHIRELRCIRPYLDFKTASTIATSIVHSELDYCNFLYYNFPKSQTNRLQVIQNSLARAVVKTTKFCNVTPILKSLHWLKINKRIEYKLLFYLQSSYHCSTYLCAQPDLCSAPSCYSIITKFSTTYIFFSKNHQSLISLCITSSLKSTSGLIPSALHKTPC